MGYKGATLDRDLLSDINETVYTMNCAEFSVGWNLCTDTGERLLDKKS
jgi:hypothetical protein